MERLPPSGLSDGALWMVTAIGCLLPSLGGTADQAIRVIERDWACMVLSSTAPPLYDSIV